MSDNIAEPPDILEPKIFEKLPDANQDTFAQSVVIKEDTHERLAAVLYAPDLQFIGSIDNTQSEADASYSKSVTEGFQIGVSVTISSEFTADVNAIVVKGELKVGLSITFSAQYNKATTETISFTVPAKKNAFLYQGYIRTKILKHDPAAKTYAWADGSAGRFLTHATATSTKAYTAPGALVAQD